MKVHIDTFKKKIYPCIVIFTSYGAEYLQLTYMYV